MYKRPIFVHDFRLCAYNTSWAYNNTIWMQGSVYKKTKKTENNVQVNFNTVKTELLP